MKKEAIAVIDNGDNIVVIDKDRQMWLFKKSKGKAVITSKNGGYIKCRKTKK